MTTFARVIKRQRFRSRNVFTSIFCESQALIILINSMYTKEELEAMDTLQLMGIAEQLGIKVSPDDELETVVYAILDKAAEESAMNATATPKRKRTRIVKKDTSKVYTVNGKDGENFDLKNKQGKLAETKPASLFNDLPAQNENEKEEDDIEAKEAPKPKENAPKAQAEPKKEPQEEESAPASPMEQTEPAPGKISGSRLCALSVRLFAGDHFQFYHIDQNLPLALWTIERELDQNGIFIHLCSCFTSADRAVYP